MIFLYRTFNIGRRAEQLNLNFAAYISYGIGLWLGTQALIHMCVASGLLPTKGLTLPLMSYGGSSIITMMVGLGLLFRVDRVVQLKELQNYQDEQEAAAQREIEESKIRVAMK